MLFPWQITSPGDLIRGHFTFLRLFCIYSTLSSHKNTVQCWVQDICHMNPMGLAKVITVMPKHIGQKCLEWACTKAKNATKIMFYQQRQVQKWYLLLNSNYTLPNFHKGECHQKAMVFNAHTHTHGNSLILLTPRIWCFLCCRVWEMSFYKAHSL